MSSISHLPQRVALKLIKLYQATPTHLHSACRYQPTCSQYTYEAIQKYGILKGSLVGFKRILRCHPQGGQGYDPLK